MIGRRRPAWIEPASRWQLSNVFDSFPLGILLGMAATIDRYRLERPIGRGSTGEVWLGWEEGFLARPVAIKRIRSDGQITSTAEVGDSAKTPAEALRAEADTLAALDHPHLVEVLAVVADDQGPALVMPFVRGGSLRQVLDERGTLSVGELVAVLRPIADALCSIARAGLVHGDVKPENILLTSDGQPLLADFGIARLVSAPSGGVDVVGTPAYLDPAVAAGEPADHHSDTYALAVIAYEALCGRQPHRGDPAHVMALAAGGVHRSLTSWRVVPEVAAATIDVALDPDRSIRPVDAAFLVAEIAAAVDPVDIVLPGPAAAVDDLQVPSNQTVRFGPAPPGPDQVRERPGWTAWLAVAAVVAVAVLAIIALASLGQPGPSSGSRG